MSLDGSSPFSSSTSSSSASSQPASKSIFSKLGDGLLNNLHTPPSVPSDAQLEYLFEEEYKATGPSWGARICYGSGTTYLSGLAVGGAWGLLDGLRNPLGKTSCRLRMNCILNACTSRGPFVANNLGMLALLYNLIHGGVIQLRDGAYDEYSAIGSAAFAGLVYKSTAGPKPAAMAAGLMGGAMGLYQLGKMYQNRSGPFKNISS